MERDYPIRAQFESEAIMMIIRHADLIKEKKPYD